MAERIQEYWGEIKATLDRGLAEWGIFAVVILVGLISFGLGRLSALQAVKSPISIAQAAPLEKPLGMYMGGLYLASRTGSAYYFPWCGGAEKIASENRVWFKTAADAEAAGYAAAKNCKGLQ